MSLVTDHSEFITTKRPILSAPGTKVNDQYYSNIDSVVNLAECTYYQGKLRNSLSSLVFGSQSQIFITQGSFIGQLMCYFRAPNLVANQTLPRGWGYILLRSVTYMFGGAVSSEVRLNKQQIWQVICSQCDTAEKLSNWLNHGGQALTAPLPDGQYPEASIFIPTPWSVASGLWPKKEIDTTLMTSLISITIELDVAAAVYGGSGTLPSALLEGTCYYRSGELSNPSLSLQSTLANNPSQMYSYPFIYHQGFTSQTVVGSANRATPVILQIQGFLQADLVGMLICAVKNSDISPDAGNSPNPFNTDEISNVILKYNGNEVYNAPGKSYKLSNEFNSIGASYYQNNYINPGTVAPFVSVPVNNYMVYIDFTRIRAAQFNNYMQNTWRIGNNTMQLSLNTTTNDLYTIFILNQYNAVCEMSNGQAAVFLN